MSEDKDRELMEPVKCCVCGKDLPLNQPILRDANNNPFCASDYKEYALSEGKKDNKPLLLD